MKTFRRATKHLSPKTTLADRLLAQGQRLRATETMTAMTVALIYTAKWVQAGGGR